MVLGTDLHEKTLYEITKYTPKENAYISVGTLPSAIDVNSYTNTIYVANLGDNTVSVIDGNTNTKIGKDIPVGKLPFGISVYVVTNTIYVANSYGNTVSLIDGTNNTKIGKDIPVGKSPNGIGVNSNTNTIYVANNYDNTVSVIDGTNNTNIGKDIPVGKLPLGIGVNSNTNTIYVANNYDNTVSVIDGKANKVVAKVMFNIEPFNALITFLPPPSIFDFILDFLHMNTDKPESKLNITKFGSFTANFRALPPPIPAEYVATLFTVVATAFIGSWLTPTVIGWRKARTQRKYVKKCIDQIGKLDKNAMEDKIIEYYVEGKLSEDHRQLLKDKIAEYYGSIKGTSRSPF
jgi:YVTN family beta-propeller protein